MIEGKKNLLLGQSGFEYCSFCHEKCEKESKIKPDSLCTHVFHEHCFRGIDDSNSRLCVKKIEAPGFTTFQAATSIAVFVVTALLFPSPFR